MNGFKIIADTYRKIDKKKADIFDFLATCDNEDIYILFDSSAFNEIAKDYMREAVRRLIDREIIDDEQGRTIRNEYSFLLSEQNAEEISKGYN